MQCIVDAVRRLVGCAIGSIGLVLAVSLPSAAGVPQLVHDIRPQTANDEVSPSDFVDFDGRLVFVADDGVNGRELWMSDGTTGGTSMLVDIAPGATSSNPSQLAVMDGVLYFFATDASGISRLMRLAGVGGTPEPLAALTPLPWLPADLSLYCEGLWLPTRVGAKLYVAASDGQSGFELWSTDGTIAGTHQVADIGAGAANSAPCSLTTIGNLIYFSANTVDGREPWVSDGTAAGTRQVADVVPGTNGSSPINFKEFKGQVYFGDNVGNLWKFGGTETGATRVIQALSGPDFITLYTIPAWELNGKLLIERVLIYTQNYDDSLPYDVQLLTGDGTEAGTTRLDDVTLKNGAVWTGSKLYFVLKNSNGLELWLTDGTAPGTRMVKNLSLSAGATVNWTADFNGTALFVVDQQLWRSDGTDQGTLRVAGVPPSPSPFYPTQNRLTVGQKFFFSGIDPVVGAGLYVLENERPLATPDSGSVGSDSRVVTLNVTANDTDADGAIDPASAQVATGPSHGTVTRNTDGTLTYTASNSFSGTDTFTYTVSDTQGATSDPETVTVTVAAPPANNSSSGSGGGGAVDLYLLFGMLTLLVLEVSRSKRQTTQPSRGIVRLIT